MGLLEYENQIFLELFQEDGLVVLGKGLGVERLLVNLIKTYSDPGNLVLIIGTNNSEEEYLINQLNDAENIPAPKVITSEFSVKERYDIYMGGGVLFVSTRILVVDMLVDRIPIDLITGIIVYRAHKILESCQEAFILRLYRFKNQKGFVKAISSNPRSFTRGFAQIQRIMRNLFVGKLYLWPRFHTVVSTSMEKVKPEVIEIHVPMTSSMQSIQVAILDLISVSVKELQKINPTLDTDELTVENAISRSFDKIVKYQLDPMWHQLSSKTRRLISDLKFFRSMLRYLTHYDCVTFYNLLKSVKENVNVSMHISDWLFLDASEMLFLHAKDRLYNASDVKKKKRKITVEEFRELDFETNPKWNTLSEILNEIAEEAKDEEKEAVAVIVEDHVVSNQLLEILSNGAKSYLFQLYDKLITKSSKCKNDEGKLSFKKGQLDSDEQTLTQMMTTEPDSLNIDESVDAPESCEENVLYKCSNLMVEFYPLKHMAGSHHRFQNMLELYKFKYVILYDVDMEIIRRIELHQALNPNSKLKVYFLVYSGSSEEQCYLTTLRCEKEAFEFLIKEKAHMVLPEDIDGKNGNHPDLIRGSSVANETVNSRKAGGQIKTSVIQKIIVDMREFRSELPSLIHRRGIEVIPITLEVGDYILTPDICVERKSVSDLIGSLNSGRLYTQAQAMCRLYKRPILLIEFDQNKAFSLQGKYYSGGNAQQNVTSKLILLTCHFPSLRILWCTSPYTSAEMFEILKTNKEQPSVEKAMLLKPEGDGEKLTVEKFNPVACDFISKLPGVNSKNMWNLMNKMKSIENVTNFSESELSTMLENATAAKVLWNSIHVELKNEAPTTNVGTKKLKKNWRSRKNTSK